MSVVVYIDRKWTRRQLLRAYDMAEKGASLREIAPCVGHTAQEVDLLLWSILCTETVTQALELVNGEGDGGVKSASVAAPNG